MHLYTENTPIFAMSMNLRILHIIGNPDIEKWFKVPKIHSDY